MQMHPSACLGYGANHKSGLLNRGHRCLSGSWAKAIHREAHQLNATGQFQSQFGSVAFADTADTAGEGIRLG